MTRLVPGLSCLAALGACDPPDRGTDWGSALAWTWGDVASVAPPADAKLTAFDAEAADLLGWSVAGGGDFDGDGYDDVVVGAYADDDGGEVSGSAYVFYGSPSGIDLASQQKLTASDGVADDAFGWFVSGAGDLDADGYDDVLIGARSDDGAGTDSGSVYVYLGSPSGVDLGSEVEIWASDGSPYAYFGWSVAGAGDVDGDGYGDVVVGARAADGMGAAYVYYGSPTGLDLGRERKITASDGAAADDFGDSVSGVGDVDGDGYDDVVVGAWEDDDNGPNSGSVYVYYGGPAGIDLASEQKLLASDGAARDAYGDFVSGAMDVDADGFDDVVVGAHRHDGGGAAYVYFGSATGVDPTSEAKLTASDGVNGDHFASSVSGAGDVDGDGYGDVVVGARANEDVGAVYVYFGSPGGIEPAAEDKRVAPGGEADDAFGGSVSGGGDVDGDGRDEVLVGVQGDDDHGDDSGAAYLLYGAPRSADVEVVVGGACPGLVTLDVAGSPGATYAFLSGAGAGTFTVPAGPCTGVALEVGGTATLRLVEVADGAGALSVRTPVAPAACGAALQLMDTASCARSAVVHLP